MGLILGCEGCSAFSELEEKVYLKRLKLYFNGIDPSLHLPYKKKNGGGIGRQWQ